MLFMRTDRKGTQNHLYKEPGPGPSTSVLLWPEFLTKTYIYIYAHSYLLIIQKITCGNYKREIEYPFIMMNGLLTSFFNPKTWAG